MFIRNLKGIMQNFPLILSDSDKVTDVSLNQVIIFIGFWLIVLCFCCCIFFTRTITATSSLLAIRCC